MKYFALILVLVPIILAENIFKLNVSPEEAKIYLSKNGLMTSFANKIHEMRLEQIGRSHDGHEYYYRGRLIENPQDYVESTYLANQFHGHDGYGRTMFGYKDWNQGRVEARNVNGEIRGQYRLLDPEGKDVVVDYWSDSLGFHQTDNRPKTTLNPVTETPEVRQARQAHERAWRAAAQAAKINPDPQSDYYNRHANKYDEEQAQIDQALEIISGVSNQKQGQTRYPSLDYAVIPDPNSKPGDDTVIVEASDEMNQQLKFDNPNDDEEENHDRRGFFYSYDYPVQLLEKISSGAGNYRSGRKVKREQIPVSVVYEDPRLDRNNAASKTAINSESNPIAEIHDAQVHPLRQANYRSGNRNDMKKTMN